MGCRTTWVLDCVGLEGQHWLMAYGLPGFRRAGWDTSVGTVGMRMVPQLR
jgi:hypothetical protein